MARRREIVLMTGAGGFIGGAAAERLSDSYDVVGLDLKTREDPHLAASVEIDLGSDESVADALDQVRARFGNRLASVIHLAAYFDLTGEPNPKYQEITVDGTRRLLSGLQQFDLEQFIFASTMLVHAAGIPGETIDESRPLDPKLPYRASKIETERVIHTDRGQIPVVYLRPAGVYDDQCRNPFIARQIARIYERRPKSFFIRGTSPPGSPTCTSTIWSVPWSDWSIAGRGLRKSSRFCSASPTCSAMPSSRTRSVG